MEYGSNILKTESAYYELKNASISDGILTVRPGGSAKCTINSDYIVKATEYFMINLITEGHTDNYVPKTRVDIHFVSNEDEKVYNYTIYPTESGTGVLSQEIHVKAGDYKDFTFEISSKETIRFLVWELCPEAADENIKTVIEGVEQSLPKLLYDYNMWPLHVDQDERTIALITFRLLNHTDLQGHFQLTYVASEATTLTLRFKDNEATELFSPLLYDLHAGRGSVGVPHAYLERLAGIHSLIVTAQVTHGSLAIETRGVLFTIDGGYLAERMLDVGADMQDISIRQLSEDNGPDEIWVVGIEKNECLVRKRKYDPKATVGFEPALSLGYAREAAIEFDGRWVLRANSENYTLETEEYPWVFWVDKDYYLQAQIGNDESTRVTLERFATCIHTCRGYKSELYPEQDQGIILVFIKNEQAYYVQYQYNKTTQTYRWGEVIELDSSLAAVSYITVNRLNDYRVQITVKHATGVKTYISDRTYVNQATFPEVYSGVNPTKHIFAFYPKDYDITLRVINQTFEAVTEDISDGTVCRLTFTVDKILKFTGYDITELITFNSDSVPEYNEDTGEAYVNSVFMHTDTLKELTTFTISLKYKPKKLVTYVYLNSKRSNELIQKVGPYGYIISDSLTIMYDSTITLYTDLQRESVVHRPIIKNHFEYKPIGIIKQQVIEEYTGLTRAEANFIFNKIRDIKFSCSEGYNGVNNIVTNLDYKKVTDKPI